ncbi:MAG: hypothetical protein WA517_18195 [Candidatus Acidiferrum sp.]
MRPLRIFAFDILAPALIVGWLFYRYPETLDSAIRWIAFGVLWHLTLEVLQTEAAKVRISTLKTRYKNMIWFLAFLIGGLISIGYVLSIKVGIAELAKLHAAKQQPIRRKGGFTVLIPIDTSSSSMPIPIDENPADPHAKFYRDLTFSITDRQPDKTSGYLMLQQDQLFSDKDRPRFLGKLIQLYIFKSIFSITRESYGIEVSGGKVRPIENRAVIPPDVVSSPTDHVIADLADRRLLNGELQVTLKNFPLHMPKGTNIGFTEQTENESILYVMRMERPGFFKFDLTVRPVGNSNDGALPDKFQSTSAKTIKTYTLIVTMDSVIQVRNDDGFEPDKYVNWIQDTFVELRRRMTF